MVPVRIEQRDLDKYPHLRAKLGLPEQPTHSADDQIIPAELWREPDPLPPIVIVHHGSDHATVAMLLLVIALVFAPLALVFAILSMQAPAMLIGVGIGFALSGALALHRKDRAHHADKRA